MAKLNNLSGHANSATLAEKQVDADVTANALVNLISDSAHRAATLSFADGLGSPTEATILLGEDEARDNWLFVCAGSPGVPAILEFPAHAADAKQFAAINETGQSLTIRVTGGGSPSEAAVLASGERALCHWDGTNVRRIT